jgi:hypothetical protein
MHCTLLVPDLLRPPDPDGMPYHDLHLPALTRLLARARCTTLGALGMEAWLCEAFGIERQHDWPVAPLTLAVDGGDPGNAYWLRCDPVHLRTQRDQLLLTDISTFAPTPDEARTLIATLNAHFAQDGLVFHARHPARWYLRVERQPALTTQALPDVGVRDIDRYLPAGDESLQWHRMLNEVQMLLHAHPVNQARETAGQPAINSVWLWGGGVKPAAHGCPFTIVWSDDALALALADTSDIPARPLPDNAIPLIGAAAGDARQQLAVLPQLRAAMHYGNTDQWRTVLNALEKNWFAPLFSALRRRRLTRLTIIALGVKQCRRYDITGGDLWKFWRPIRTLRHYA